MSARPSTAAAAASTARRQRHAFAQNDKLRDVTLIGLGRIEAPEDVILDRQRQSLCRLAPRRHHPLLRARLREDGGLRPYRRPAARHGVRPRRQSLCLHRRHGPLPHHARTQGREGHRRDQPQPLFGQRRQPPAARRRSRHRRRRPHLLLRGDRPLRDARMAGRRAGGARQRPHHLLRPQQRHHAHGAARPEIPQRHLRRAATASRSCSPRPWAAASSATGSTARRRARSRWSSTTFRATPTTSTSRPTATTGWPWSACASPALDLAWRMPGFRKRMGKRVPIDEWLFPNINTGCVIKFNEKRRGARDRSGTCAASTIR